MRLLSDILLDGAERFADREAVSDRKTSLTYGELAEQALRMTGWLARKGVRPGNRVMLSLPNEVGFAVAHFGILLAGAISVPCEANATAATLNVIRESCRPTALIDADELADALAGTVAPSAAPDRVTEDVAAILYTTGSTGRPKGVMLSHANTLAALGNIIPFVGYTADDREVVTIPLAHSFGLGHLYCNLACGGAVFVENGLTRVGRVLRQVEDWGATGFPGTPLGYAMLMDRYGEVFRQRCRNLRFVVINSAPLPPEQAARIRAMLPDTDLMVYYGLTEASRSTFISHTRCGPATYASVGPAMPGLDIKLGDDREILIKGPTVALGYWEQPELTAAAFQDGYLHTGDQGEFDEAGFLRLTGRLGDRINVGGLKVYPAEIEQVLMQHDAITDVCAFGTDSVEAAVALRDTATEAELAQFCHRHLEPFKVPTRFHAVTSIQRSATGKVLRHAVAVQCRELDREADDAAG